MAPAVYYRRLFVLDRLPERALLRVTALGVLECEINGRRVSDDVFCPGWTDYRVRLDYRTYDVTECLHLGENVIGVVLGDGWYCGHVADRDRQFYGERPELLAAIEDHSRSIPTTIVVTDAEWRYSLGPILENDLLMGESYDARRELGDWSRPTFDAARWASVEVLPEKKIEIGRALGPPVRRQETLAGTLLPTQPDLPWNPCIRRFDFGQNFSGRVRLRLRGLRGQHLSIRHAECLHPDGSLYLENLRSARATDHYTLAGNGVEEWEPRFTFHGFRYCEIRWQYSESPPQIESVEGVVLHSEMERTGWFECSHAPLNQLASNILWSQKSNFLEVPTDCPQRDERLGWTGDAQAFIRSACFFMDVEGFFRKWLRDLRDCQAPGGLIPAFAPNNGAFGLTRDGGPAWADAIFICPWTIYLSYGDTEVLRENYPAMVRYLDYLAKSKVLDGIRAHPEKDGWGGFGDWLALDGSGDTRGGTPMDLIGTAFHGHGLDITARTAAVLGFETDANHFAELHDATVNAFVRRFVAEDGLLVAGTQTAYVLALHFDLLPGDLRAPAASELVRLIEANGFRIGTGFVGTPYLLHVLEATGHLDVANRLLECEDFPSWLFPVKNGATTMWERWDGWTPEKGFQTASMNSFNHYAYGAVADWMVSTVAGIQFDAAQPGYRHIIFKPRPGGSITWAEARLRTPHGEAFIRWERVNKKLRIEIAVPSASTATLWLDARWDHRSRDLAPGHHQFDVDEK